METTTTYDYYLARAGVPELFYMFSTQQQLGEPATGHFSAFASLRKVLSAIPAHLNASEPNVLVGTWPPT